MQNEEQNIIDQLRNYYLSHPNLKELKTSYPVYFLNFKIVDIIQKKPQYLKQLDRHILGHDGYFYFIEKVVEMDAFIAAHTSNEINENSHRLALCQDAIWHNRFGVQTLFVRENIPNKIKQRISDIDLLDQMTPPITQYALKALSCAVEELFTKTDTPVYVAAKHELLEQMKPHATQSISEVLNELITETSLPRELIECITLLATQSLQVNSLVLDRLKEILIMLYYYASRTTGGIGIRGSGTNQDRTI